MQGVGGIAKVISANGGELGIGSQLRVLASAFQYVSPVSLLRSGRCLLLDRFLLHTFRTQPPLAFALPVTYLCQFLESVLVILLDLLVAVLVITFDVAESPHSLH